jgi:hypothetical protein
MGVYIEQAEYIDGRPAFVGGCCNDMLLDFSNTLGWTVRAKEEEGFALLYSMGTEALPQLAASGWIVSEQRRDTSSVRVQKFKKRETMLKLSGGQGPQAGAYFEGVYRKQASSHDSKPMYCDGNKKAAIWFVEGFGWCVGLEKDIGTHSCLMHADDFAPTPDAVQSSWMVRIDAVKDSRVQVVLPATECTPSPSVQQHTPAPAVSASIHDPRQQGLHSAPENTPPPPMIAVVGVGEGYSGLYKKQQRLQGGKALYKGSRAAIYSMEAAGGHVWCIGPIRGDSKSGCLLAAHGFGASPHTLGAVWHENAREPCSSARVTKSKKKHTKAIEVKGVPADHAALTQLNGKYRQQAHIIGGRPTFKGGEGGNHAIWYSESAGSWRIGDGDFVGTAVYQMHAKDIASMPSAVKSTWEVKICAHRPYPYAKIVLPTIEAAEQEVPRQMQLKMVEVLAAEQKRCLGCGHEYVTEEEVVYHEECMHHHCACCGEKEERDACAVCAEEEGK